MSDGWQALAHHIVRWRVLTTRDQAATRAQYARRIGISPRTLDNLESATRTSYDRDTIAAVEIALGWESGSVDAIVAGGKPTPAKDTHLEALEALWPQLDEQARVLLVELARRAVAGWPPQ